MPSASAKSRSDGNRSPARKSPRLIAARELVAQLPVENGRLSSIEMQPGCIHDRSLIIATKSLQSIVAIGHWL